MSKSKKYRHGDRVVVYDRGRKIKGTIVDESQMLVGSPYVGLGTLLSSQAAGSVVYTPPNSAAVAICPDILMLFRPDGKSSDCFQVHPYQCRALKKIPRKRHYLKRGTLQVAEEIPFYENPNDWDLFIEVKRNKK